MASPPTSGPRAFVRSVLDPRAWLHVLRMVHFYNYSHVQPLRRATIGAGVALAPTVTIRNGARVSIGDGSELGDGTGIWAGGTSGRIDIGRKALLGPGVYVTASNYTLPAGLPVMDQPTVEADVRIGDNVWLGRGVVVLPGVTIGDGCVVGAGAVVTNSLQADSIAVGVPARVVGSRD